MITTSQLDLKKVFAELLRQASIQSQIENDITPIDDLRKRLPPHLAEQLAIEKPIQYYCQCGKVISRKRIRCLRCQATFLKKLEEKQNESD